MRLRALYGLRFLRCRFRCFRAVPTFPAAALLFLVPHSIPLSSLWL